jgi:Flp pilus assembly protein TadD
LGSRYLNIYKKSFLCFYYLAQRIAQANDKALLNDVLIGQAKQAFDNNDFPKAESFLLQAQRPDLAVKLYKDNGIIIDIYLNSF